MEKRFVNPSFMYLNGSVTAFLILLAHAPKSKKAFITVAACQPQIYVFESAQMDFVLNIFRNNQTFQLNNHINESYINMIL